MRAALAGLTTRGRSLVAAGIAAALCAVVLGEKDLLRVAIFVIALPLVAALVVARTRFRLSCKRILTPSRISVGQPAEVQVEITNLSRLPTGMLLLEDTLPFTLGGRPRFVVDRVPVGQPQTATYTVRSELRGKFSIGPLLLRLTDPFGLIELSRSFSGVDTLTVVPPVYPLPHTGLGGAWSSGGDSTARSVSIQGEDDVATREYRHGDDLRKVHWRSTARTGRMMVRREEQPWQTRSAMLVDTRYAAHRGEGSAASLEWSITATASIGVHLGRAGYSVRLFTDNGELHSPMHEDFGHPMALLDTLAVLGGSSHRGLDHGVRALRETGEDGLLVVVLGDTEPDDVQSIVRGRVGTATSIAVLLDTSEWLPAHSKERDTLRARHDAAARAFRSLGWRVVSGGRSRTIAEAWSHSGVTAFASAGAAPAAPRAPGAAGRAASNGRGTNVPWGRGPQTPTREGSAPQTPGDS